MKQIKLSSAVVVAGKIERSGTTVEVADELAADLIRRGKAVEVKPAAAAPDAPLDKNKKGK